MLGKKAVESGYKEVILIKIVAEMIKGGGGGRENYAALSDLKNKPETLQRYSINKEAIDKIIPSARLAK